MQSLKPVRKKTDCYHEWTMSPIASDTLADFLRVIIYCSHCLEIRVCDVELLEWKELIKGVKQSNE